MTERSTVRLSRRAFIGRVVLASASVPAMAALAESCASQSPQPSRPTTLRVRQDYDIKNLDPAYQPTHSDGAVGACLYEGLVAYQPGTWKVVNVLAETFEASKDGLQYHFTLKRGIPFHKGYGEVTADDVKFSYERIAGDPQSPYYGDWEALQEVRVEGKYEGTIILKRPFAPLMRSTLPVARGQILSRKAVQALGNRYPTNPIGSGPYEFESWEPKQRVTLKRFAQYGGAWQPTVPKPAWEEIQVLPIAEDNAAQNAFDAGDLDHTSIPPQSVGRYRKEGNVTVATYTTLGYGFISMNVRDPLLSNLNLRRAIRQAIDVPGIIQAVSNGAYTRARAIIPKAMGIGYWADAPRYDRDLAKAKAYLEQSGLQNVSLTLHCVDADAPKTVAQIVQQNLKDIGIQVQVIPQDSATFNDIPGNGGGGPKRQLVFDTYVTEPDPSWSIVWFTCPQVGQWNWAEWCDPQFQSLYDQALTLTDQNKRSQLYVDMQKLWDAQANMVWTYYPTVSYVTRKPFKLAALPDGTPLYWAFQPA